MIDAISLTNVLAFRSITVDTRGLTLLSGTNSAGKSSVLHALAMLRQSHRARTLPDALLLNGTLVELGTGRDILHSDPADLPDYGDTMLEVALASDNAVQRWVAHYETSADVLKLAGAPSEASAGGLFDAGFQYLRADRIVPAVTYPKSHEAVTVERFLGARGEHAPNYLRVHGDEAITCRPAAHPAAAGLSLHDQTNAWLDVLSPGTSLDVMDVEGTDFVRLSFLRSGPDVKSERQRATNVGFGLTYALPVIVACLTASSGSLLLIENPEAHLHPHGQAAVGRLCALAAAGGAQVIMESHSDHVLNAVRLAVKKDDLTTSDVILQFFSRSAGVLQPGLETLTVEADGMLPSWPRGFFDEWDQAVGELLD